MCLLEQNSWLVLVCSCVSTSQASGASAGAVMCNAARLCRGLGVLVRVLSSFSLPPFPLLFLVFSLSETFFFLLRFLSRLLLASMSMSPLHAWQARARPFGVSAARASTRDSSRKSTLSSLELCLAWALLRPQ